MRASTFFSGQPQPASGFAALKSRKREWARLRRPSCLAPHLGFVLDPVAEAIDETERLGDTTGTANLAAVFDVIAREIDRRLRT